MRTQFRSRRVALRCTIQLSDLKLEVRTVRCHVVDGLISAAPYCGKVSPISMKLYVLVGFNIRLLHWHMSYLFVNHVHTSSHLTSSPWLPTYLFELGLGVYGR